MYHTHTHTHTTVFLVRFFNRQRTPCSSAGLLTGSSRLRLEESAVWMPREGSRGNAEASDEQHVARRARGDGMSSRNGTQPAGRDRCVDLGQSGPRGRRDTAPNKRFGGGEEWRGDGDLQSGERSGDERSSVHGGHEGGARHDEDYRGPSGPTRLPFWPMSTKVERKATGVEFRKLLREINPDLEQRSLRRGAKINEDVEGLSAAEVAESLLRQEGEWLGEQVG
jgi:hypothetical protein